MATKGGRGAVLEIEQGVLRHPRRQVPVRGGDGPPSDVKRLLPPTRSSRFPGPPRN